MKYTLYREGRFYKGNLHSHTTRSDGRKTPEEVVALYRSRGYDFLSITDHNIYTDMPQFCTEDFLLIPGMEINPPPQPGETREYHILVQPGTRRHREIAAKPQYSHDDKLEPQALHSCAYIQTLLDDAWARGNALILNHPSWSKVEYDQVLPLKHLMGMEILNYCSTVWENTGEGTVCWDGVLRGGMRLWGFAADDNHNAFPLDSGGNDSFGGYIMVKAPSLKLDDIIDAIAAGSFYATGGPEIKDFYVENCMVHFYCSPVTRIYLNGHTRQIRHKLADPGGAPVTELICPLYGDELYVRAECYDAQGRKAYTNPIWLGDALSDSTPTEKRQSE